MGIFDLSEQVRYRLRERFWLAVDRRVPQAARALSMSSAIFSGLVVEP